jgi:NADPH:quinone reductase
MQAICFEEHGDPARVLKVKDIPRPVPQRGEVLVRMLASPINPSDLLFVEGHYSDPSSSPAVPGFEGVGIVESAGRGLLGKLLVGRRVAAINRGGGNWAEYAVIPAKQAIPVPKSMADEQAATFFVNPGTALVMTRRVLNLQPGEWLLQSAAASSLGRMIIRLGQHSGFRTLSIVRRQTQVEELKRLGADEVLVFDADRDDPDHLIEQVRAITGGGVRCAVDPVGGVVGSTLVRCVAKQGCVLAYGTLTPDPLVVAPRTLIGPRARIEGFHLGGWMDQQSLLTKVGLLRQVGRLIGSGVLSTEIAARVRLPDVPGCLQSRPAGKVLIDISGDGRS